MNKETLSTKLDDFILDLMESEKADRTIVKYKGNIKRFIASIKHNNDINKFDVIKFKDTIRDGRYKPSTINSYIIGLNKYLDYCDLAELKIKTVRVQMKNSLEGVVSKTDYERIVRQANRVGEYEASMAIQLIARTGIRVGELDDFTVEAIQKTFYIRTMNKGKDKYIVVPQDLMRQLRKYCRDHKIVSGKIFQLSKPTFWRRMKRLAGLAKVNKSKVHAHSFRHLFAKEYMAQFNNVVELADILGHNSLDTTKIYTRTTLDEKRRNIEQMEM